MKILKSIIICLILFVSCFTFTACSSKEGGNCSFSLMENSSAYEIHQKYSLFSKTKGEVVIPSNYKNLPVTNISDFACCHDLTSVRGGTNIKTIESNAFGCRCWSSNKNVYMHLKELVFDKDSTLNSIGSQAFFKCVALEKVVLPKNFQTFGEGVFFGCTKLKALYIYNITPPTFTTGLHSYQLPSGQLSYSNFSGDFAIYVPSEAVEAYKNSAFGTYNIKPIEQQ